MFKFPMFSEEFTTKYHTHLVIMKIIFLVFWIVTSFMGVYKFGDQVIGYPILTTLVYIVMSVKINAEYWLPISLLRLVSSFAIAYLFLG